jgi:hypothetical protein
VKDLEHVIEVDFQFGGRQEQTQRTGRLMHSVANDKIHDILMTKEELERYGKRLYGLFEKGFRPRIIPHLAGVKALTVMSSKKRGKRSINNHESAPASRAKLLDELLQEGFFRKAKTRNSVCDELRRRGYSINALYRSRLGTQLNRMVRAKKLYRTRNSDNVYEYEHRE